MFQRIGALAVLILTPLLLTGCFDIIHYLDVHQDGTVSIRWRMSISRSFEKQGAQPTSPADTPDANMDSAAREYEKQYQGFADSVKANRFKNQYDMGVDVNMRMKNLEHMALAAFREDDMPIVPIYNKKSKELVFRFTQKNTSRLTGKPPAKPGTPEDPSAEAMESQNNKLARLFFSTATYDIYMGSGFMIDSVQIRDMDTKETVDSEVITMGNYKLIRIPFLSAMMDHKKGYEVIIKLQDHVVI